MLVRSFDDISRDDIATVGGKGANLGELCRIGLPVPPGFIVTTAGYRQFVEANDLQERIVTLATRPQSDGRPDSEAASTHIRDLFMAGAIPHELAVAIRTAYEESTKFSGGPVATRSSATAEDLPEASFAGQQETYLNIKGVEAVLEAVKKCWASLWTARAIAYRARLNIDAKAVSLAVVVQRQIESEVAGVGFSLNPLTNDYDEAVIDANWGQGESVVAGCVSPDHFVVDKITNRVIETTLGTKQVSIWLDPDGETVEREGYRSTERTLSDAQLVELSDVMCRIEALYDKPMDIEWAYASGQLYVLQARPITAYVPLPHKLVTEPGSHRRLYMDASLAAGLTTNKPISPMGLDWMEYSFARFIESLVGRPITRNIDPEKGLWLYEGGRMYVNVSNMLWVASPKTLAKKYSALDELTAEIVANIDAKRYRAAMRPSWARLRMLRFVFRILWRMRRSFWNVLWTILSPQRSHRAFLRNVNAYEREFSENVDYSLPLDAFRRTYLKLVARNYSAAMSVIRAYTVALKAVDQIVPKKLAETEVLSENLKRGFTGDIVVEMGIALFRLANLLDRSEFEDLIRLSERIKNRQMSQEFLSAWDAFVASYGCRGPMEMDLASPRYGDDPAIAVRQMSFMPRQGEGFDPEAASRRRAEERRRAYEVLMSRSGWLRRRLLHRVYRIIDLFAGTRDTPKHLNMLLNYAVRKRALIEGRRLVEEGRLDAAKDIFDLTYRDLESASLNPSLDLRELCRERTRFLKILAVQVTEFPSLIDSRGRILRPPQRKERSGELSGVAVSPGMVTGPVKVLHSPHEKHVDEGDVLVAYTTDPGWTPLFTNAAAVVLEVGGVLQHGAIVAREYGKPCVVGVDRVMKKLRDGQRVEVDGTAGVIRLVS
ncbi:MAG: hypothetical protein GY789_22120 [Hyphomicrobiales bacterium]|nr:hypothetical protein [Hyphomicrobiales bacterium]MCP4999516.1 hypothetical protein [Hyphomicrobiales bacterium]